MLHKMLKKHPLARIFQEKKSSCSLFYIFRESVSEGIYGKLQGPKKWKGYKIEIFKSERLDISDISVGAILDAIMEKRNIKLLSGNFQKACMSYFHLSKNHYKIVQYFS